MGNDGKQIVLAWPNATDSILINSSKRQQFPLK